ncbi:ABC transporter substrate-binding protein [Variovorax saccharolyticus]|uniref:ABC transporter substrate-binding protein n=1 Tax=Variovorax saccharolyticus TaxID=3053516 RepID=UPI002575B2B7|nr:ABC transporter substrate-binding protein [Variovorax sp. J31P216]MDM0029617.1 ABC transporter substrate-binding protein [Variovorax sp. J31P216]
MVNTLPLRAGSAPARHRISRRTVLAAGLSVAATGAPFIARGAERLVARMDLSPWGVQAAMQLAKQKGWFNEAGLDIEIQDGTGTISTLQLLGSGQVDVGQVQLGPMMVAKETLGNLMSFAGFVRTGDLAVMTDKKLNITKPSELIGKKLICFTTSPWAPFIKPYLAANGISPEQVNIVMVAPAAVVATFSAGEGDGFLSVMPDSEPRVRKTRPVNSLLLQDAGIAFPSYGLVATKETLAKRREELRALAQIQKRAWTYIYAGHADEAVQAIIAQRPNAKLDAEVLKNQIDIYRPFFESPTQPKLELGLQTDVDWSNAIRSLQKIGLVKADRQPSDYYTNDLIK